MNCFFETCIFFQIENEAEELEKMIVEEEIKMPRPRFEKVCKKIFEGN